MVEAESKACTSQNINPSFTNDVGNWPGKATEEMRDFWAKRGSENCQHLQEEYKNYISQKDGNKLRCCTSSLFYPECLNGEKVIRSWLCCSPGKRKPYCFVHKLFNESRDEGGCSWNGYSNCKNATRIISSHEISAAHKNAVLSVTVRGKETGSVEYNLAKQIDEEWGYYATLVFIEKMGALEKLCHRAPKSLIWHWPPS